MEQQQIQPIKENLWWVIPGKLAGVRKPVTEELTELQAAGIGALVSVMDDLIWAGLSYDEAMQTLQDANPNAELREAQTTFLQELAEG